MRAFHFTQKRRSCLEKYNIVREVSRRSAADDNESRRSRGMAMVAESGMLRQESVQYWSTMGFCVEVGVKVQAQCFCTAIRRSQYTGNCYIQMQIRTTIFRTVKVSDVRAARDRPARETSTERPGDHMLETDIS
jgi:hypothetical protein